MQGLATRVILFTLVGAASAVAAVPELRAEAVLHLRAISEPLIGRGESTDAPFDDFYRGMVERLPPQRRAEAVLQHVVNQRFGAAEYLLEHAESWRGQLKRTPTWDALWLAARNSPRIEARLAALELHLVEAGVEKRADEVERMLGLIERHSKRPDWGYFNLGALGARGVERERILGVLEAALARPEREHRLQAVEALALLGGAEVVAPLLVVAGHETDDGIRERAFCGLASSGLLHLPERYLAVPGLLEIGDRPQLQANTRTWVFQALREITGVHDLPDDARAWRPRLQSLGLL
jgi:hypothetical protein